MSRAMASTRQMYRRLVGRRVSRWLDRRWEAAHPFPIKLGCGPWSSPEDNWHGCPDGHEWERIDWPYGRATLRGSRADQITRCATCGAPRCDSYNADGAWKELSANEREGRRCTLERHHSEAHDYLDGTQREVGA
jgi:hypothetical protein